MTKIALCYKLKPLPKNTSLELIIELMNIFYVTLWVWPDTPEIQAFIDKHPELVERVSN